MTLVRSIRAGTGATKNDLWKAAGMRHVLWILIVVLTPNVVSACNVPVFRYALERWKPDSSVVRVFHDGPLSETDQQSVKGLQKAAAENGGPANVSVEVIDVSGTLDDDAAALWKNLTAEAEVSLPHVVLTSPAGRGKTVNHWQGTLAEGEATDLLQSPLRERIGRRLLAGDSAVWIVLKSSDEQANSRVTELLNETLPRLARRIPLPEGVGLPGSELLSSVPLVMRFRVEELDPNDPREQPLVRLLQGLDPQSVEENQPLVVPVFGRGRALEVIPAGILDEGLIEDLTVFLCGACSCQVKEMNPGFDLLMHTAWDQELYGDNPPPPEVLAANPGHHDHQTPELVTIPPGRSDSGDNAALSTSTSNSPSEASTTSAAEAADAAESVVNSSGHDVPTVRSSAVGSALWMVLATAIVVVLIVLGHQAGR